MRTPTLTPTPYSDLLAWLEDHDIPFAMSEHATTYTAAASARADHVDPHTYAKVVGVGTPEGGRILAVLDATDDIDMAALAGHLGVTFVRLLAEEELAALAPELEVGTLPPVPELANLSVVADDAVRADRFISFHAGSHRHSIRVDRAAWERAAGIGYASFARRRA